MLTLFAHTGRPPAPHDAWGAWGGDPLVLLAVLAAAALYARGRARARRPPARGQAARFGGGLLAVAAASQSPLEAAAHALASAHMVQHVLLVLVAAPLLAWSAPLPELVRGTPPALRRAVARARRVGGVARVLRRAVARARRVGGVAPAGRWMAGPGPAWLAHVAVLWLWHSAALYDAALRVPALHALEHAMFLGTALLFWHVVAGPRTAASHGARVLLVFTMGMQSVFLALLLTFARAPWYASYRDTTAAWGLTPLADQQLAGAIMWVPAGFVYAGLGIALVAGWLREVEAAPG